MTQGWTSGADRDRAHSTKTSRSVALGLQAIAPSATPALPKDQFIDGTAGGSAHGRGRRTRPSPRAGDGKKTLPGQAKVSLATLKIAGRAGDPKTHPQSRLDDLAEAAL